MRAIFITAILWLLNISLSMAQLTGKVVSSVDEAGIIGASLRTVHSKSTTLTDNEGKFRLMSIVTPDTLLITAIGFEPLRLPIDLIMYKEIKMQPTINALEEVVVNTGYQALPKERATGSFTHIDRSLLERSAGYNILERLSGITSGLNYDVASTTGEPTTRTNIRIRGLSTINGENQPLIILDNFPYEDNIENINPNDIESVTVLKDAAAASIWGARAGNGVIVITSKTGRKEEKANLEYMSSFGFGNKPDLFYDPRYIPSSELIDLEVQLFNKGIYKKNDWTEYSPVVDLLFSGSADEEIRQQLDQWRRNDIRRDAEEYLYRRSSSIRNALSIRGGSNRHVYAILGGYDRNNGALYGDNETRLTLTAKNSFQLGKRWEIQNSINLVQQTAENNGISLKTISPTTWSGMYTYGSLKDMSGNAEALTRVIRYGYAKDAMENGLLDWTYRPLNELKLNDRTSGRKEVRINTALLYRILPQFHIEGRYQYQLDMGSRRELYTEDSFFTRHLINQFTQSDLTRPVPIGDILDREHSSLVSHYGRLQSTYQQTWRDLHNLNVLGGVEIRQERNISEGTKRIYGYNDDLLTSANNMDFKTSYPTRPNGATMIPYNTGVGTHITDRFVSYYGNLGYSFMEKYLLSASMRWDGSNIFGVDFNQKGVPLWSAGIGWNLHKEDFIKSEWLDILKLRATFGANGNVLRSQSALPYIRYGFSNVVSRSVTPARLSSVGNPSLSWEKVSTLNLGFDFALFSGILSGSMDWYHKNSENLLGSDYLDPTTGVIPVLERFNVVNVRNYADMQAGGVDIELSSLNTKGSMKWRTDVLFNFTSNRVTNYYASDNLPITSYLTFGSPTVRQGRSRDIIYAIPWHGLDEHGDPLVLNSDLLNTDYVTYFNSLRYEDLLPVGVSVSPYFGSFRNSFDWKSLLFSFNITWRAGHKYRRESVVYDSFFRTGIKGHEDYLLRWMKPGDEMITNVPAMPSGTNTRRDQTYMFSDILIENASSIRLQDIQLSYTVKSDWMMNAGIKSLRINSYARNLGILWKASKSRLDPDARAFYPQPFQLNVGVQANF